MSANDIMIPNAPNAVKIAKTRAVTENPWCVFVLQTDIKRKIFEIYIQMRINENMINSQSPIPYLEA